MVAFLPCVLRSHAERALLAEWYGHLAVIVVGVVVDECHMRIVLVSDSLANLQESWISLFANLPDIAGASAICELEAPDVVAELGWEPFENACSVCHTSWNRNTLHDVADTCLVSCIVCLATVHLE